MLVYFGVQLSEKYTNTFNENSIKTKGTIINIIRDNSLVDLDGDDRILNYIIEYSFNKNGNLVTSFNEIDFEEYHLYFNYEIKIGDSINILYHKEDPKKSQIQKLVF